MGNRRLILTRAVLAAAYSEGNRQLVSSPAGKPKHASSGPRAIAKFTTAPKESCDSV